MHSDSSAYVRKTTGFFTDSWRINRALESYFEEHAKEVWERMLMNPEMQTTLRNQLNAVEEIAGPVPEIPLEYDKILKDGGGFLDDVNGGYLPEKSCVDRQT